MCYVRKVGAKLHPKSSWETARGHLKMCRCSSYQNTDSEPTLNGLLKITALRLFRVQPCAPVVPLGQHRQQDTGNLRVFTIKRSLPRTVRPGGSLSCWVESGQAETESSILSLLLGQLRSKRASRVCFSSASRFQGDGLAELQAAAVALQTEMGV